MLVRKCSVAAAVSLGIICVPSTEVVAQQKGVYTEVVDEMVLFENDIFVDRVDQNGNMMRGLSLSAAASRWPNGVLPYQFHPAMSDNAIELANRAIDHWNQNSTITLEARDPKSPDAPADYVEFVTGPGCASWVGRQGQVQEIWVSDYCTTGSLIHEIGHALGLLHEHTRSDRDQYIQIRWENIKPDKAFNFEISDQGTDDRGPYDYGSIMHYGDYFFSATGEQTIVPLDTDPDIVIGQRKALSTGDLDAIKNLYASDLNLGVSVTSSGDTTEVTFSAGNLHENGANGVEVMFSANASGPVPFYGDANGSCEQSMGGYRCALGVVPSGGNKSITVSLPGEVSELSLNAEVVSKTHDINPSNNGSDSGSDAGTLVARADTSSDGAADAGTSGVSGSAGAAGGGSGGGANHMLGVAVLFILSCVRLSGLTLTRPRSRGFGPRQAAAKGQGLRGLGARRRALPGLKRMSGRHFSRKL